MNQTSLRTNSQSATPSRRSVPPPAVFRVLVTFCNPYVQNSSKSSPTHPLLSAQALLQWWHLASLDAPTVAVTWSLAFAWAAHVRLPFWVPILLALGTWAVYIADRLLDARAALASGDHLGLRERHHFHWRNRYTFSVLAAVAACVSAAIVFVLMPAGVRERNSVLALAALAYFAVVHSRRRAKPWRRFLLPKEFLVGVLFTAGCALPTFSRLPRNPSPTNFIEGIFFADVFFFVFLAWLNCSAIEHWESSKSSRVFAVAILLSGTGFVLSAAQYRLDIGSATLIATGALAALLLAFLDGVRGRMSALTLRASADLVLLTPLVLIPLALHN